MFRLPLLLAIASLLLAHGYTQGNLSPQAYGYPFIQNFNSDDYKGLAQNWAVAQDSLGYIYVASSGGLLVFDGVEWENIPVYQGFVRGIAKGADGKIYVGAYGDFGVLEPDSSGTLAFHSLLQYAPEEKQDFEAILNVVPQGNAVYFGTDSYLYRWDVTSPLEKGGLHVFEEALDASLIFEVDGAVYIRQFKKGLIKVSGDSLELVPGGDFFAERRIHTMIALENVEGYSPEAILIGVPTQGFFVYDEGEISPFSLEPESNDYIQNNPFLTGNRLKNGNIVLACLQGGAVEIDLQERQIAHVVSRDAGLRDAVVTNVFEDQEGDWWLTLFDGLSHVEMASPFRVFNETHGMDRDLDAVEWHNGQLYMGGSQGILRMIPPSFPGEAPVFESVEGINQITLDLKSINGELLAASAIGVFTIKGNQSTSLSPTIGACIYPSPFDSEILYIGLGNGILVMKRLNGRWEQIGLIKGLKGDYRTIIEVAPGELWTGTSPGFNHIQLDMEPVKACSEAPPADIPFPEFPAEIRAYPTYQNESLGNSYVFSIEDAVILSSDIGLFKLDPVGDSLVADSGFLSKFPLSVDDPFLLSQDQEQDVWAEGFDEDLKVVDWFQKNAEGGYQRTSAPFYHLDQIETIFQIYQHPKDVSHIWFAGDNGLISFEKDKRFDTKPRFRPSVRKLSTLNDSVIFGGAGSIDLQKRIPYSSNALKFSFAFPAFDRFEKNQFQYKLEGFDEKWSSWSVQHEKEYTNLPEGNYSFRVRGKNIYQETTESTAYTFRILPPWYRTAWAYFGYLVLFGLMVWTFLRWRTRKLKQRNKELEAEVKARTEEVLQAREQMIVQERMASLGQMTAGIAHEIKNPLNFVNNFAKGSADLVEEVEEEMGRHWDKIPGDDASLIQEILADIKENSLSISKHGSRADMVINSMMQHAEGTSGQRISTNLNTLIQENLEFGIQGHGGVERGFEVNVEKNLAEDLPEIQVIPQEISRVFLNIFQNALYALEEKTKSSPTGFTPRLVASSSYDDEFVTIRIHDNGKGIPENIQDKIFQPFFTTKPTGAGNTGLGLSIAYDIIAQSHNGSIDVESKPDSHTAFTIKLPIN